MPATGANRKAKPKTRARKGCRPRRLTHETVLQALGSCYGIRQDAASKLGVTRTGLQNFIAREPGLREKVLEQDEALIDAVEGKLFQLIEQGSERSIHFYLSTKGRHRGFTTRVEQTGPDGRPIQHEVLPDHSTETVLAAIERIAGKVPPLDLSETAGTAPLPVRFINGNGNGNGNGKGH